MGRCRRERLRAPAANWCFDKLYEMLYEIFRESLSSYFTGSGGILALMQSVSYGLLVRSDYLRESNRNRRRLIASMKKNVPPQIIIGIVFFAYCFLVATYARLDAALGNSAKLEGEIHKRNREIAQLRKENAPQAPQKKDFYFSLDAGREEENVFRLKVTLNNRTTKRIGDYSFVICAPDCELSLYDSMFVSRWIRHEDRSCRSFQSNGESPVGSNWGLSYEHLRMTCPGNPKAVKSEITLSVGDAPPYNYGISIPLATK